MTKLYDSGGKEAMENSSQNLQRSFLWSNKGSSYLILSYLRNGSTEKLEG